MLSSYAVRKSVFILAVLSFVLPSIPCLASVSMKVTGGFDSVAKTTAWTPIAIEIENTGDRSVKGTLEVVQGDQSIPCCTAEVDLPGNSRKLYHVYARLREYGEVIVLLRDGDSVRAKQRATLNFSGPKDAVVVSVGGRSSQLTFLNRVTLNAPVPGASESTIAVGSIPANALPDRPAAYDGVDVLVISGMAERSANPRALTAVSMWVASGGTLVVSTGADFKSYRTPFYDELLPVTLTGSGTLTQFGRLSSIGGVPFPAGSMAVATNTLKPGISTQHLSESGIPIYAERRYGAGKVIFLAFDHLASPFKDWDGQTEFWKSIVSAGSGGPLLTARGGVLLQSDHYGPYRSPSQSQDTFPYIVQQTQSIKMPSFTTIVLFLLGYIVVLVPVNYFVLHKMRRRELAWVTTPAIILIFTIGAYGIGYTMKGGRLQINEATFIEASSNCRYARALTEATVFSPASRSYDVKLSDPSALLQMLAVGDEQNDFVPAKVGERLEMERVRMAMWSSKSLEAVSGMDLGGHMKADLVLTGTKLTGTVRNNTGIPLSDCVLIWGSRKVDLGALAKGKSASVDLDYASGQTVPTPTSESVKELEPRFRSFAMRTASRAGRPVLLAVSDGGKLFGISGHRPKVESCVAYAFYLDYTIGSEFALGPGAIPGRIVSTSNVHEHNTRKSTDGVSVFVNPGGHVVAAYRLPMPDGSTLTDLKVVSGRINAPPDAPGYPGAPPPPGSSAQSGMELSAYNHRTANWDQAQVGKSLSDPAQYLSPNNEIRVKIKATHGYVYSCVGISAKGRRG